MSKPRASVECWHSREDLNAALEESLHRITLGCDRALPAAMQFLKRYAYCILNGMLNDRRDREEVFFDSLIKLYRQAGRFDTKRGRALDFYKAILKNCAIDRIRKREPLVYLEIPYELPTDNSLNRDALNPAVNAERNSDIAFLSNEIDRLNCSQRKTIAWVFKNDSTLSEASEELNIPLGTAKSAYRRGLLKLRAELLKTA
ncbi:RNA polymerase sigma factor [Pelagicoccus albus]|uniref:Sigma-70 family RNA polymerase sigma factor n=1 Tax=Pelagicoccus albus TaxID=415222 RepID=A0A7X1E7Y0_9BACT|nr:sigma-70 family RNA polymerase sigma factor [Pelagicoccus albus]MBC2605613.1 sigma-70 family RNA polymerase sigma factor [Pelagicoccus albus]